VRGEVNGKIGDSEKRLHGVAKLKEEVIECHQYQSYLKTSVILTKEGPYHAERVA
jgi:hypothetical protein